MKSSPKGNLQTVYKRSRAVTNKKCFKKKRAGKTSAAAAEFAYETELRPLITLNTSRVQPETWMSE